MYHTYTSTGTIQMPNDQLNLNLPNSTHRRSVELTPDFWVAAKTLGNGNATFGIKLALHFAWEERTARETTERSNGVLSL